MFYVVRDETGKLLDDLASIYDEAHRALTLLHLATESYPTLSYDDVVERGLLMSKLEPTFDEVVRVIGFIQYPDFVSKTDEFDRNAVHTVANALWWARYVGPVRGVIRGRLEELLKFPTRARDKHIKSDFKVLEQDMLISARLDEEGKPIHKYYPRTVEAAYRYTLVLLYALSAERWKRLRKCPNCDCFFLRKASPTGGRPRDYCSAECQKKADQKKALDRQKKPEQRAKQRKRRRQ